MAEKENPKVAPVDNYLEELENNLSPDERKRDILTDRRDIYKIGAWLDHHGHFKDNCNLKFYWAVLALITPIMQINLILKIGLELA
jgi:hypothetical protein